MMDSFELSKIAGAVLAALLVIFLPKTAIEIWGSGHGEKKSGYELAAPEAAPQAAPAAEGAGAAAPAAVPAAAAAPAAAFDGAKVAGMIAAANASNGQGTFKKCLACHSADKASASKAGPNLWGVVGRKRGGREDFASYSEAMKAKGGEWSFADLAAFVHSPKGWLPGTKMIFPGVADASEVADLLAYMRTLADSPAPLPN